MWDRDTGSPGVFRLVPGRYLITYSYFKGAARSDVVELKAGHVYRVEQTLCNNPLYWPFPGCWGMKRIRLGATIWIEDRTTGEVLAGERW
jgi:hypothetical protein